MNQEEKEPKSIIQIRSLIHELVCQIGPEAALASFDIALEHLREVQKKLDLTEPAFREQIEAELDAREKSIYDSCKEGETNGKSETIKR